MPWRRQRDVNSILRFIAHRPNCTLREIHRECKLQSLASELIISKTLLLPRESCRLNRLEKYHFCKPNRCSSPATLQF